MKKKFVVWIPSALLFALVFRLIAEPFLNPAITGAAIIAWAISMMVMGARDE